MATTLEPPRLVRLGLRPVLGVVALALLVHLLGVGLGPLDPFMARWSFLVLELGGAVACALRAIRVPEERRAWTMLAVAASSWANRAAGRPQPARRHPTQHRGQPRLCPRRRDHAGAAPHRHRRLAHRPGASRRGPAGELALDRAADRFRLRRAGNRVLRPLHPGDRAGARLRHRLSRRGAGPAGDHLRRVPAHAPRQPRTGDHRPSHRAWQQAPVDDRPARSAEVRERQPGVAAVAARPGSLQGLQRQSRPPGRRRPAGTV